MKKSKTVVVAMVNDMVFGVFTRKKYALEAYNVWAANFTRTEPPEVKYDVYEVNYRSGVTYGGRNVDSR